MSNLARGRTILRQRVEYPLPVRAGVRDYIFYCVPSTDLYGAGARTFFDGPRGAYRVYRDHVRREVPSLEALVSFLYDQVQAGTTHIREIVIVVHATDDGLSIPLLDGASAENLPEYRAVTTKQLAWLQRDFAGGRFPSFKQKRQTVIARVQDDSWVTIRGCNIGSSADEMYGLYSFFGGRANIYAPRNYQFFGSTPIGPGMRIESRLGVHRHLVRQRFLPHDHHTPDRKDAITRLFTDPARFSAEVELVRAPDPDDPTVLEGFVDALNRRRIPDALRARFAAHEHPLTDHALVKLATRSSAWIIEDTVTHQSENYVVQYDVFASAVELSGQDQTLVASATVYSRQDPDPTREAEGQDGARERFPIQLFIYQEENDLFHGKLFDLAGYAEHEQTSVTDREEFQAFLRLLQIPALFNDEVDLREEFLRREITLTGSATISLLSDSPGRTEWTIDDVGRSFRIVLAHPTTVDGDPAHTLKVYDAFSGEQKLQHEAETIRYIGEDPDTPGPELAAYLDRLQIDELTDLIDHLRTPYRGEHSLYIYHAQQAIRRKSNYTEWLLETYGHTLGEPLARLAYVQLDPVEQDDKSLVAYDFDFNRQWTEVKASHPALGTFDVDLFEEEDLWYKLGRDPQELANRENPPLVFPDFPATDLEALRAFQSVGLELYHVAVKEKFQSRDDEVACQDFRAAITRWKELRDAGTTPEEIERLLGLEIATDGSTYWDIVKWTWSNVLSPLSNRATFTGFWEMAFMQDAIEIRILRRIPGISRFLMPRGVLARPAVLVGIWDFFGIFWTPLSLWWGFLDDQESTERNWRNRGAMTAVKQWLRELKRRTNIVPFPEQIDIDLGTDAERLYKDQYSFEFSVYNPRLFTFRAPLQEGFDKGVRMMDKVGREILDDAWKVVGSALRDLQLEECKAKALVDVGLVDVDAWRAAVVREIVQHLLDELPRIR